MNPENFLPHKTSGLVAATFTPFFENQEIDISVIKPYAERLTSEGISGVFINGTTGEGASLTVNERIQMAEAWVEAAPANLRTFIHVGHTSLPVARELAGHAARIGADAVACIAPFFFKPRNVGELVDWCAEVAAAAGELPFYYYHMPSLSGVDLKMAEVLPLASQRIPNFAGMKFTYEDLEDYKACLAYGDNRFEILFGRDEILLDALELGATGAVGTTYNFTASLNLQMISAYKCGDLDTARKLQEQSTRLIDICVQGDWHPVAAFKWLMMKVGLDCGATRLPIPALSTGQAHLLETRLEEFFQAGILKRGQTGSALCHEDA